MKAKIKAISYYLPEKVVTNEDLIKEFPEWTAEKIASKLGIEERRVASENETASDMAEKAAHQLFEEYNINPKDIDFIILCTQSPDYHLPPTACVLQSKLGLSQKCGALDIDLGCSGYIYGLSLCKGLVFANIARNILFLTAESYNKYIHPKDKGNRSIFGDAATATLVSTEGIAEIGEFVLGTDGSRYNQLIVESGCSRVPNKKEDFAKDNGGYIKSADYLYMSGGDIFNFTLDTVPPMVMDVLQKNNLDKDEVNMYVFHQANKFILSTIRKLCRIKKEKFYINLAKTGNTVSNTLPIALKQAIDEEKITSGDTVLITGFGVGLSWGGTILKF